MSSCLLLLNWQKHICFSHFWELIISLWVFSFGSCWRLLSGKVGLALVVSSRFSFYLAGSLSVGCLSFHFCWMGVVSCCLDLFHSSFGCVWIYHLQHGYIYFRSGLRMSLKVICFFNSECHWVLAVAVLWLSEFVNLVWVLNRWLIYLVGWCLNDVQHENSIFIWLGPIVLQNWVDLWVMLSLLM